MRGEGKKTASNKKKVIDLPVNCGVKGCLVGNFDNNSIIFLSINNWSREESIYSYNFLGVA